MKTVLSRIKINSAYFAGLFIASVVGGLTATVVMAAIPDSNGVINGCRSNVSGSLRVIDTATTTNCLASETRLDWNQTGPQGPIGPQGPAGPASPPKDQIISNYVTVPWSAVGGQEILEIPNIGVIRVVTCSDIEGASVEYYNNTSDVVDFSGTPIMPNGTHLMSVGQGGDRFSRQGLETDFVASTIGGGGGNYHEISSCKFWYQVALSES